MRQSRYGVFLKAALSGLFDTEDHWRLIVFLPLNEVPSFISRGAAHQEAWALSASEGRYYVYLNLAIKFVIHTRTRFFYMPQSWDMGHVLLPLRTKACWGFFQPKKSDGFGRERTRDLGYQRPACWPLASRYVRCYLYCDWNKLLCYWVCNIA
jgi:hypothetical protein